MFIYKGYRWTFLDFAYVIVVISFLIYFVFNTLMQEGFSLASIAGSIWGAGTLAFIFIYPLPIFGGSIEGERLLKEKEKLTEEEMKIVMGRGNNSKIAPETVKAFFIFFIVTGVLCLVGVYTNT